MTKKRIFALILACAMTASSAAAFTSCAKKEKEPVKEKRTNVYSGVELPLPEGINYINQLAYANGNAYVTYYKEYTITYNSSGEEVDRRLGYFWDNSGEDYIDDDMAVEVMPAVPYAEEPVVEEPVVEVEDVPAEEGGMADMNGDGMIDGADNTEKKPDQGDMTDEEYYKTTGKLPVGWWYGYESFQNIATIPLDGSAYTETPLKLDDSEYGYLNNIRISADGRILATTSNWVYDEETGMSSNTYYLINIDPATGAVTDAQSLNEVMIEAGADPMNIYINSMVTSPDGSFYVTSDTVIVHLDANLKLLDSATIPSGWINTIVPLGDKLLVSYYEQSQICKYLVNGVFEDINSAVLKEVMGNYYGIIGSTADGMYYRLDSGVYKYDPVTDTSAEVLNFINSDIDSTGGNNMVLLEDGRMLMASTDYSSDVTATTLQILTKIPDEELAEEIIVKIGVVYTDYNLTKAVIRYNKQNTGIRISVVSYEHYNNEENEWNGAVQQLNNDIITGKLPDMVYLNTGMPVESYFQKGIFADLNQFIDDPELGINRNDFMTNVFDANSVDGKLYSMIFSYTLTTLVAENEHVGTEPGWTFDEMMATIKAMPEGMRAFFDMGRDSIVRSLFNVSLGSFVDWEKGTNKFDSQGFIDFMKYLANAPEFGYWEEYYNTMGDEYVYDEEKEREMQEGYSLRFYNDTALFNVASIGSFTDFLYQRNDFASKDITAIGYPTDNENSNGAVIVPQMEIAISASSNVKTQAWEILKFIMSDETLNNATYRFSINKLRNEENMAKAAEEYYYWEPNESEYEWYREYGYSEDYINYMKNSHQPYDQAAADYVMNLINGATEVQRTDKDLVEIITEEMSVFFSGTRSAEETAKIIASRANIYIAENS